MIDKSRYVTIQRMTQPTPSPAPALPPPEAAELTVEFFTAQIRNPHTRAAYATAMTRFFTWCDARGLALAQIFPIAVATYIDEM